MGNPYNKVHGKGQSSPIGVRRGVCGVFSRLALFGEGSKDSPT